MNIDEKEIANLIEDISGKVRNLTEVDEDINEETIISAVLSSLELVDLFIYLEGKYDIFFGGNTYYGLTVGEMANALHEMINNKEEHEKLIDATMEELFA